MTLRLSLSPVHLRRCLEYMRERVQGPGRPAAPALPDPAAPVLDANADLAVVRRVLQGEAAARDELIDRIACLPAMVRVQHARRGAPLPADELDDVVQEVLLALWRKLARFDGRVPLLMWAHGFVSVELHKALERRGRRQRRTVAATTEPAAPPAAPELDRERLHRALADEPRVDAQILRLRHFEGLDFETVARTLGMPLNTVKTRHYRCLERLRRRLGSGGGLR